MKTKKEKFDVKVLERRMYIKPILKYLKEECGLKIESSKLDNHIWFLIRYYKKI